MDSEIKDKNLDLKTNLKANYGVVYSEGLSYVDQGPTYEEQLHFEDCESLRFTVKDYKEKYQKKDFGPKRNIAFGNTHDVTTTGYDKGNTNMDLSTMRHQEDIEPNINHYDYQQSIV